MLDPDISAADALARLSRQEGALSGNHDARSVLDRRRFLQLVGMGAGAGLMAGSSGSLLDTLIPGYDPSVWAAGPIGANDGVLVILGMFGGNDGLNTVVPFNDPLYYQQHGGLAIPGNQTLALDGDVGLHPALTTLKSFWDTNQLAIVEGIGYPNPDLSHFNSMAYWMAGRPNQIPTTGWVGRWLDGYLNGGTDLFAAAEIGNSVPLHLIGEHQRGTGVPARKPDYGASTDERSLRTYQALRDMRTGANGQWFGAVGQAFVDYLDVSKTLAPIIPEDDDLPSSDIVARMEIAARLINADLGFRVLTAGYGDFDSHAGQPNQHTARMEELNAAVGRFFQVLDPAWLTRVTFMTFSEFGRTPWSNDGAGTDHGTSAPHFVVGANVAGGRYGQRPSMAGLDRWERMPHHVDMRSYYGSMIDGWMGGGASDIVGAGYETLPLFARGPGIGLPGGGTPSVPVIPIVPESPGATKNGSSFVPVPPMRVADTRDGTHVPAGPLGPEGVLTVKVTGIAGIPDSGVTAVIANVTAVDATTPMFFTVYPGGTTRPNTSNINGGPGRPVPNLVMMAVGSAGTIDVYNSHGSTHCLVDVFGYFTGGGGDRFTALPPQRLFDTRSGQGVRAGKLGADEAVDLMVAGAVGVPARATAVVMNLGVTEPENPGFLRLTPKGAPAATTSNVNFFAGDTVPNLVVCQLGTDGSVTLDGAGHGKHAFGDVFGYFSANDNSIASDNPTGERMQPLVPARALDTRDGTGADVGPIGPQRTLDLQIGGRHGVPSNATAVVINVAATNVAAPSFVSVWPGGTSQPDTSNLNVMAGQTLANLVICQLGETGNLHIGNPIAECDVLADVLGYFVP